jgi:hypothetical protein
MLSHQLSASGDGFLWPPLLFESDGQAIEISMHPSGRAVFEPIKYLGQFRQWVAIEEVESAASAFINKVLSRLAERGLVDSQLHKLWAEIQQERLDPPLAAFRRIEAILGFDPGEAGADVVKRIQVLEAKAGRAAAEEVAHATHATSTGSVSELLAPAAVESASAAAPHGEFGVQPGKLDLANVLAQRHPWHKGYALAYQVRSRCNLNGEKVTDEQLAGLLGLDAAVFRSDVGEKSKRLPFGVAVRSETRPDEARFVFRSPQHVRRRFEAARMIADYVLAPASDAWLPTTAAHTARQKTQRAFAAELLCPSRALKTFLGDDTSSYAIEDAAEHFAVAADTVTHQIANHWR